MQNDSAKFKNAQVREDALGFLFGEDGQENKKNQNDSPGDININHSVINIH